MGQPGTYDQLSYIRFSPIPSPGSSGAPIIDEESGSVVAVVTGHGTINRIEGHNGFGTPAEAIFEVCEHGIIFIAGSNELHPRCFRFPAFQSQDEIEATMGAVLWFPPKSWAHALFDHRVRIYTSKYQC